MSKGRNRTHSRDLQIQSNEFDFFKRQQEEMQEQSKKKETFKEHLQPLIDQIDWTTIKFFGAFLVLFLLAYPVSIIVSAVESMSFQSEIAIDGDWNAIHWSIEDTPKYKLLEALKKKDNAKVLELWKNNRKTLEHTLLSYSFDANKNSIQRDILINFANDKDLKDFKQFLADLQLVDVHDTPLIPSSLVRQANMGLIKQVPLQPIPFRGGDLSLIHAALEQAAQDGQIQTVKYLMRIENSVDIATQILPFAVEKQNLELSTMLFEMGATTDKIYNDTVTHIVRSNNLPLIKLLVKYGYDVHFDDDHAKRTAMLLGEKEMADYLTSAPQIKKAKNSGNDD